MRGSVARLITVIATWAMAASFAVSQDPGANPGTYGEVVKFVGNHSKLVVLSDNSGASIAVWPAMQGRVLTSTAEGPQGRSFGWYNRDLVASGKTQAHMNAVGGEDRLWLGPEGGQFSIFFAAGAPFDLEHWYTPAPIDTEPFDVVGQTSHSVAFRKRFELTNYSGTRFNVQIDREVRLLSSEEVWTRLAVPEQQDVKVVGFESQNRLTNLSSTSWSKERGLLSLWVLGQFESTPQTTIVLPIRPGPTASLGVPVTTDYFGAVPEDRISIKPNVVLFKADAHYRSKLGLSPQRARGVLGSYDAENHVLTIVQYSQPDSPADYVNSTWKMQKDPYQGDVANCYNDGPPAPGKPQLGHFYELESSSPALALKPRASVQHTQRTIHLLGSEERLDELATGILGVKLKDVQVFNSPRLR